MKNSFLIFIVVFYLFPVFQSFADTSKDDNPENLIGQTFFYNLHPLPVDLRESDTTKKECTVFYGDELEVVEHTQQGYVLVRWINAARPNLTLYSEQLDRVSCVKNVLFELPLSFLAKNPENHDSLKDRLLNHGNRGVIVSFTNTHPLPVKVFKVSYRTSRRDEMNEPQSIRKILCTVSLGQSFRVHWYNRGSSYIDVEPLLENKQLPTDCMQGDVIRLLLTDVH